MKQPAKKSSEENKPQHYTITIKARAVKALKKIPRQAALKLDGLIQSLAENPRPAGCKKLEGYANVYRLRYANYRIVYTVEDKRLIVDVVNIGDRKEIYKNI